MNILKSSSIIVLLLLNLASMANAQTNNTTKAGKEANILDANGDGWDDLWCAIYPGVAHRDRAEDTDGDGITDYDEMLLWRNPLVDESKVRAATPEELARQKQAAALALRAAEIEWQKKLAEAAPQLRQLIPPEQTDTDANAQKAAASADALRNQALISRLQVPAKERALDALARKHGVEKEFRDENGRKLKLSGESMGPIYIGSHDTTSAAGISADELWPSTAWPHSDDNTGLNLSGAGQTLGMWEVDGGVRLTHIEFGTGRVTQQDGAALDATGHATNVAGTMAAGGVGSVFGAFNESRGVAYGANVFAYETALNFRAEREAAAAGNGTNPALRLSNHSWGFTCGWRREDIDPSPTVTNLQWVWYGPQLASFQEDHKFGLYFPDLPADDGCTQLDFFLQSQAPQHLMVYSCGNDRTEGPGSSPGTYYYHVGQTYTSVDATTTPRDWDDGDAGFFDTVASPGTAKNVLTVGACEDVYRGAGANSLLGIGFNANTVPAFFSGAGPTDDGRIKPDLVAVGTTNVTIRQALGLVNGGFAVLLAPTASSNTAYTGAAIGTSFAAPAVTGGLALVQQRRAQLFPQIPAAQAWAGSTLKAMAINTCDDVGAEGPDYRMGFGIFNAVSAALSVDDEFAYGRGSLIKEFPLAPNESVSWNVVCGFIPSFAVTAAWSDPPGPALTTLTAPDPQNPMLINNLDLRVDFLGFNTQVFPPPAPVTTYYPWVLNPDLTNRAVAARSAPATRGVDGRNNVEKVSIAGPTPGLYRITVTHSGGLAGNPAPTAQLVSVAISGAGSTLPTVTSVAQSPTATEFLLSFTADPGAYFTIQTSVDLVNWVDVGSVLAAATGNSVMVTSNTSEDRRFWRLRRGQ